MKEKVFKFKGYSVAKHILVRSYFALHPIHEDKLQRWSRSQFYRMCLMKMKGNTNQEIGHRFGIGHSITQTHLQHWEHKINRFSLRTRANPI